MKRQVMMLRHVSFIILFIWMLCFPSWVKSFGSYKHQDYDPVAMRERYDKWVEKYGKQYKDRDEREKRFGIYASNVQLIDQVNSQNLTYKLTDNKFADLTNDEFKATYLGYRSPPSTRNFSYAKLDLHSNKTVDWRKKGVFPPIKDQGQCGSCWAFSAVSAVESINKIKTGKLLSLSEQELVDCDVETGNEGCSGGFMNKAFQFVKQNGITTEENYPYKGSDGSCDRTKSKKLSVRISGYKKVPENSEKRLQAAVDKQPVSVAMDAGSSEFQLYSEGIFTGDCGNQLNHGVNAVGYGQVKGEDLKYWIVRNSWGIDWGESGYFRLERDIEDKEGKCGIAMEASYPVKDDDDVKNLGASSHLSHISLS